MSISESNISISLLFTESKTIFSYIIKFLFKFLGYKKPIFTHVVIFLDDTVIDNNKYYSLNKYIKNLNNYKIIKIGVMNKHNIPSININNDFIYPFIKGIGLLGFKDFYNINKKYLKQKGLTCTEYVIEYLKILQKKRLVKIYNKKIFSIKYLNPMSLKECLEANT